MRSILGTIVLAAVLTLAPSTAWAQYPFLLFDREAGAVTDISGAVVNPPSFNPCPPTVAYGWNVWFPLPPRHTGGDGVWATSDQNVIDTGGRTEATYALADASGVARTVVTADTSLACQTPFESVYMSARGYGYTAFYRTFTVGDVPAGSRMDLRWSLDGSFSQMTTSPSLIDGGGFAYLSIYIAPVPPSVPAVVGQNALWLVGASADSRTSGSHQMYCYQGGCKPVPKGPLVSTTATIDLLSAFYGATGRQMRRGDSFVIIASLEAWTLTAGPPVAATFTTDFSVSTKVRTDVELFPYHQP